METQYICGNEETDLKVYKNGKYFNVHPNILGKAMISIFKHINSKKKKKRERIAGIALCLLSALLFLSGLIVENI